MVITDMHLERLRQNGFEVAARILAGHNLRHMASNMGNCKLEVSTWITYFSTNSTSQIPSVCTLARDQVSQNIVLVTFHTCAKCQAAESAGPAYGFVDLDVRQKFVTGVCIEWTLVTCGQFHSMLLHGVRPQKSPFSTVVAACTTPETCRTYSRQCTAQFIVQGEIVWLQSREVVAVLTE